MFENKKVDGVHYTRIIASWKNIGGSSYYLKDWLRHLKDSGVLPSLTDEDINDIKELANCGKFELEQDAIAFKEELETEKEAKMVKNLFSEEQIKSLVVVNEITKNAKNAILRHIRETKGKNRAE